jgi:hypothetical protein
MSEEEILLRQEIYTEVMALGNGPDCGDADGYMRGLREACEIVLNGAAKPTRFIMEITVARGNTPSELSSAVNALLSTGWYLNGNIVASDKGLYMTLSRSVAVT